jgi:oligopeptide/dipeptide ABC transporter ATP-binding protein
LALMSAIPIPDPEIRRQRVILTGDVPSPVNPPTGCRFHPRCPLRAELGNPAICAAEIPPLIDLGSEHLCACHFRTPAAVEAAGAPATPEPPVTPISPESPATPGAPRA